jgi:hypothetical protein
MHLASFIRERKLNAPTLNKEKRESADRSAHREEDEEKRECVARELLERRSVIPIGMA